MKNILDEQARADLALLYNDTRNQPNIREFFWDVLECAGCSEEFKEYWEENKNYYGE